MTDPLHPDGADADDLELASAYLDGDIDAEQRARVDGSAGLLSLVADLARVRAALSVTPRPTADARDSAFAAALAVFDQGDQPAQPEHPVAGVRTLPRRTRLLTWTASAAAAVVLVVFAVVAIGGGSPSDEGDVALTKSSDTSDTSATGSTATLEAFDASTAGAGTPDASTDTSAQSATVDTIGAIVGPATVLPAADTPAQLEAYAADVVDPAASALVPVPTCLPPDVTVIGAVTVQGAAATVVRTADGELLALDAACTTLLTTGP